MKISQITKQDIKNYTHIDYDDDDMLLDLIMEGVKSYIIAHTGLKEEAVDEKDDLAILYMILCSEMYSNRQMTVDNDKANKVAESILGLHAVNLL